MKKRACGACGSNWNFVGAAPAYYKKMNVLRALKRGRNTTNVACFTSEPPPLIRLFRGYVVCAQDGTLGPTKRQSAAERVSTDSTKYSV
jgi:hypothetical protein